MQRLTLPLATVRVLQQVTIRRAMTQPELQYALGASAPTIFRAVSQLRDLGVLLEGNQIASEARGRRAVEMRLRPNSLCVLALVIGSDQSSLSVMDALGQMQYSTTIPVCGSDSYEQALDRYALEINRTRQVVQKEYGITPGIGVSFSGSVDPESGRLTTPSRFPGWHGRPLAADLTRRTGLPCSVDNDATALARATLWFSSSRPLPSFALVYIDSGLGAGFCFDGRIYTGQKRVPSGLAHTSAFGWSQEICRCGQQGCLETVLSIRAVLNQAAKSGVPLAETGGGSLAALASLERLASAGDPTATRILEQTGQRAATVGITLARLLDLPMLVFAGGFIATSPTGWTALDREMRRQVAPRDANLSWSRLDAAIMNGQPEMLAATAVALDGLYRTRAVAILNPDLAHPPLEPAPPTNEEMLPPV